MSPLRRFHGNGGAGGGDHEHVALAEHLVVHVDPDDGVGAQGRGALLHCFCAVPDNWQTLELTYHPDFAAGRSVAFTVNRSTDRAVLGVVPTSPAEVGSVVDL